MRTLALLTERRVIKAKEFQGSFEIKKHFVKANKKNEVKCSYVSVFHKAAF